MLSGMSASGRTSATWSYSEPCALWTVIGERMDQVRRSDSIRNAMKPIVAQEDDHRLGGTTVVGDPEDQTLVAVEDHPPVVVDLHHHGLARHQLGTEPAVAKLERTGGADRH